MTDYLEGLIDHPEETLFFNTLGGRIDAPYEILIGVNALEGFLVDSVELEAEATVDNWLAGFIGIPDDLIVTPYYASGLITDYSELVASASPAWALSGLINAGKVRLVSDFREQVLLSGLINSDGFDLLFGYLTCDIFISGTIEDPQITIFGAFDAAPASDSYGYNLFMNHRMFAPFQIAYPFNSMGRVGGTLFGAGSTGVYEITGTDIDGEDLSARFEFWADLGRRGRFRYVYLAGDFTENVTLTLTSDENITRVYTPSPRLSDKESSFKFSIRRDNGQGRYWKFKFANAGGGIMSVDEISALPVVKAVR